MEYKPKFSKSNYTVIFNYDTGKAVVSESFNIFFPTDSEHTPDEIWNSLSSAKVISNESIEIINKTVDELKNDEEIHTVSKELLVRTLDGTGLWYRADFTTVEPKSKLIISLTDISDSINKLIYYEKSLEFDELTGLYTAKGFKRQLDHLSVPYAILYFDVYHFKAINDYFGKAGGDLLLIHIAEVLNRMVGDNGFSGRIVGDRFIVCVYTDKVYLDQFVERLLKEIKDYDLNFHIMCNVGIYVDNPEVQVSSSIKIDRAAMAQAVVKGNFNRHFNYYTEDLTKNLVTEQGMTANMVGALDSGQFLIYFQPQYSHLSKKLVGAEALVRWKHPEYGMIPPGNFIPVFEKNNFITQLDKYVFEQTCAFIRKCMNQGLPVVPISTNFSRYDIMQEDFVESLEAIRESYNVPIDKIRVEITESAVVDGIDYINEVVAKLQKCGYVVEMDDFGSGYSSLNVLKDINFDIVKLDMKFMSNEKKNDRGSTILSSVVGMSAKLHMSVIAEGVETLNQADFLRDIGCEIIQGYYYSKPVPETEFVEKIKELELNK